MDTYETRLPKRVPEAGYYYHYKHDPDKGVRSYAYYIFGAGHHTEDNCRPEDALMLVYLPLYEEAFVYQHGKLFDLRPLHMFYDPQEWKGSMVERFTRITDPATIETLKAVRNQMYPEIWG